MTSNEEFMYTQMSPKMCSSVLTVNGVTFALVVWQSSRKWALPIRATGHPKNVMFLKFAQVGDSRMLSAGSAESHV